MPFSIPLLSLKDDTAPYRGVWNLVQPQAGSVEALHHTFHPDHELGCVIERLSFSAQQTARAFTGHLILHGWCIDDLPDGAEFFWSTLPERF